MDLLLYLAADGCITAFCVVSLQNKVAVVFTRIIDSIGLMSFSSQYCIDIADHQGHKKPSSQSQW